MKTPLDNLQVALGDHINTRARPPLAATDRLVKHIAKLGRSLDAHERAILLVCFLSTTLASTFKKAATTAKSKPRSAKP